MKNLFALLVVAVLFSNTTAIAQKNTLSLGGLYIPNNEATVRHGFLGYYHQFTGKHTIGVKAMYNTGKLREFDDYEKVSAVNIDLIHRWTFLEKIGRSKLNVDAGLSFGGTKQNPPLYYEDCGVGLTDEMNRKRERDRIRKRGIVLQAGIATAVGLEFALSKHFGLGFGATVNTYFSPIDGVQFLSMPNLNAAYAF